MRNNYFCDSGIQVSEEFLIKIRNLIDSSNPGQWLTILQMDLLPVSIKLFEDEPLLKKIIKKYNCNGKIAIFRTQSNTSYHWHVDASRDAALNLLIDGWNSMTFYAESPVKGMMKNLTLVPYEKNKVYLLNVTKNHTVLNFDNMRYMLSIGFPKPTTYRQVKKFITTECQIKKTRSRSKKVSNK